MAAAGYTVSQQEFTFPFYQELQPAEFEQVSSTPIVYETGTYDFSGSGEVTGVVVPTNDIVIPPTPESSSTSGCEPGDFTPAPADEPAVALIQRGTCTFEDKANNAIAAGYDAVIILNEGNPGRTELFIGTLTNPFEIPVVGLSFDDGAALYAQIQAGDESGSSTILEIAEEMAELGIRNRQKVRFAFWGPRSPARSAPSTTSTPSATRSCRTSSPT